MPSRVNRKALQKNISQAKGDPKMVKAYVLINVKGGTEYELFENLMKVPGLEEISLVWGLFDLILKIEADSANALDKLVSEEIRKYNNISSTMTMLIRDDE